MTVINAKPSLKTVYEQDYLMWLEMTTEQLRTGKLENLDIENLLEEIEAMARKEKVALETHVTQKTKKVSGTAIPSKIAAKP